MSASDSSNKPHLRGGTAQADHNLVAVIPTYKVTSFALPLIKQLSEQCPTLIVDDCSPCTSDSALISAKHLGAKVLRMPDRSGIARSLNLGLAFAHEAGSPWLLTVDQDTRLTNNYIRDAVNFLTSDPVHQSQIGALGAAHIHVDEHVIGLISDHSREVLDVPELIQSGTLWNVQVLAASGGFSNFLGMDAVDAEACLRLREGGYQVMAYNRLEITHEIGDTRVRRILGRDVHITHHSRKRLNSMVTNRLRLFSRELRQSPPNALRTVRRVVTNYLLSKTR